MHFVLLDTSVFFVLPFVATLFFFNRVWSFLLFTPEVLYENGRKTKDKEGRGSKTSV
jgi:hypothetical protein